MSSGYGGVCGEGTELGSPPARGDMIGEREARSRSSEALDEQPAKAATAQPTSAMRGRSRPRTNLQSTRFYCLKPPPTLDATMSESRLGGESFNIYHPVG
jgi:hypothetical protein